MATTCSNWIIDMTVLKYNAQFPSRSANSLSEPDTDERDNGMWIVDWTVPWTFVCLRNRKFSHICSFGRIKSATESNFSREATPRSMEMPNA